MSDFELPLFCLVDDQPVLAVATREGGMDILAFNLDTLEFERDMSFLTAITLGDADHVTEEEFVRIVEQLREAG